jgi:CRISPR system Cascade subunit CasA
MDNMKARCWYEGKMPLHHIDEGLLPGYEEEIARLVRTAGLIGFSTRTSIKKALFSRPEDATGDLSFIDARFWQDTEPAFHKTLDELATLLKEGGERTALKLKWLESLRKEGERLFDDYSQADLIDKTDPKRVARAWWDLQRFTSKSNKMVCETLDLPIEVKPKKPTPFDTGV